jgi:hypothetical protein
MTGYGEESERAFIKVRIKNRMQIEMAPVLGELLMVSPF